MKTHLFCNWVPARLHVWILCILLACLTLNTGIASNVSVYVIGGLSAIPADITMASYANSIGIICAIPLVLRLSAFIPGKLILLGSFLILILINFVFCYTDQPLILVMGSFVFGFIKIIAVLEILSQLLPILMPKGERYRLYAVYFFISLFFPQVSNMIVNLTADRLPWQFGYVSCIVELLIGLLFIIVFLHYELTSRKIPLYQFDWLGTVLIAVFFLMTDYILSYGQTEDWFNSPKIWWACGFTLVTLYLLLARTLMFRRPFVDLGVFKYNNVCWGMFILFIIGLFFSTSAIQSTLMGLLFKNNPVETTRVNMFTIPGFIAGNIFCYFYYKRYNNFKVTITVACSCYVISYIQLYFLVGPAAGPADFYLPMFFRGAGNIIVFTSLSIYVANKITFKEFFTVIGVNLTFRNYLGPAVWASFISNYYYRGTIENTNLLASGMDKINPYEQERFTNFYNIALSGAHNTNEAGISATQSVFRQIQTQASLLVIREIFGFVIIVGIILIIGIMLSHFYQLREKDNRIVLP
jgi:DHA2 family multidrug resistance protein